MEREELESLLSPIRDVKYADLRSVESRSYELSAKREGLEYSEGRRSLLIARALDGEYGVACVEGGGREDALKALESAVKQARSGKGGLELARVRVERGEVDHGGRGFDREEGRRLVLWLKDELTSRLRGLSYRYEISLRYREVDSSFASTEGTSVRERSPYVEVSLMVEVREPFTGRIGRASRVVGAKASYELVKNWNLIGIIEELVGMAKASSRGRRLSPFERGKRRDVVMDGVATGAFARCVAKLLEPDNFNPKLFRGLKVADEFEVLDNPSIPGGFGSFVWDDEGVRGRRKVLLSKDQISLLHTRLTAREGGEPGNARGSLPRPSVSNVYVKPGDWGLKELFEETRNGIFVRGVRNLEFDPESGKFELVPENAYLIERKELKAGLRDLRIVDRIDNLISGVEGIGSLAFLNPKEGYSEGGPYLRVRNVYCA